MQKIVSIDRSMPINKMTCIKHKDKDIYVFSEECFNLKCFNPQFCTDMDNFQNGTGPIQYHACIGPVLGRCYLMEAEE